MIYVTADLLVHSYYYYIKCLIKYFTWPINTSLNVLTYFNDTSAHFALWKQEPLGDIQR